MYKDRWSRAAAKFYSGLDAPTKARVDAAVAEICADPVSAPGVKALSGPLKGKRRKRIGDLRLIYTHNRSEMILYVLVLDRRDDVYR